MKRVATVLAFSLIALVSESAHAQWTWLHPKPQGHNLYDVEFLTDTRAIAVGEGATIAITDDGGATWSYSFKTNGLTGTLRQVAVIDANTAVAVGDGALVLRTINGGASWTQISSGATGNLRRVDFDGLSGIMAGSSGVRYSSDGGQSWTGVQTGFLVDDLDVVTPTLAFLVTDGGPLKSTDGGQTWSTTGFSVFLPAGSRIAFADPLNGVVAAPSGVGLYYITADGGQTWQERNGPSVNVHDGYSPNEVIMTNSQTLFVANSAGGCDPQFNCFSYGPFYRTTNGAITWNGNSAPRPLYGLARNTFGTLLTVGEGGNIWRWQSPSTWQQIGGTQFDRYDAGGAIAFKNTSTGIATALNFVSGGGPTQTLIFRTSTGGSTWSTGALFGTVINDISYARGSNPPAYAVGRAQINGVLYTAVWESPNDGATWSTIWSSTPYTPLNAIDFGSATHGAAVGNNGRFAVLDNDAVTTGTISGGGTLTDVAFADPLIAVAIGNSGLFRSADGGMTWNAVSAPTGARTAIGFASATVGVAVGSNGSILRSADAGLTWQSVASPTASALTQVSFSTPTYGMVSCANGTILETTNGGITWDAISSPISSPLLDLACVGAKHSYVISWDMRVLEYRDDTVPTLFSSFKAVPRGLAAELKWEVSTDGNLSSFSITRSSGSLRETIASDLAIGARSFSDEDLTPGRTYEYQLIAVDQDGSYTQSMPVRVTIPTVKAELLPNQPNPFNPVTTIRFVVPEKMRVTITVHNVAGRLVATLSEDVREPGVHELTWNATGAASGVYFARMQAGKTDVSRKLVLLK